MTSAQFNSNEPIRFAVSVKWNKYPYHLTRQIVIMCGKLKILDKPFSEESRNEAIGFINTYLDDETAAEYIKSLPTV